MSRSALEIAAEQTERNTQAIAQANAAQVAQLSRLIGINHEQLSVQKEILNVSESQLDIQQSQLQALRINNELSQKIKKISEKQLAVSELQLAEAVKIVARIDLTNEKLTKLNNNIENIYSAISHQNIMIQKTLNKLETESQELLTRGIKAFDQGWFEDAAEDFAKAISLNPYASPAYYYLGKCQYILGRKRESELSYEHCVYYASKTAPIIASLALCDLANYAMNENDLEKSEKYFEYAAKFQEFDRTALIGVGAKLTVSKKNLDPKLIELINESFEDESVDPELLLEVIKVIPGSKEIFGENLLRSWESSANLMLYKKSLSHFYRDLDDFIYLAPRIRKIFMESCEGKFLSLGDPLSELLDWTLGTGEEILKRIEQFPPDCPGILMLHRNIQSWNLMLTDLNSAVHKLTVIQKLVSGEFVEKLNLGLIDLPHQYEDDKVLFEINTNEGDLLALTCYYLIFSRNNQVYFSIPLHEAQFINFNIHKIGDTRQVFIITDTRYGQILIQGSTDSISSRPSSGKSNKTVFLTDLFLEILSILGKIHECLSWGIKESESLFSIFLVLNEILIKQDNQAESMAAQEINQQAYELVEEPPSDFEVVDESADPAGTVTAEGVKQIKKIADKWYIAKNKKKHGPFTWKQLVELTNQGKITSGDLIQREGEAKWKKLTLTKKNK